MPAGRTDTLGSFGGTVLHHFIPLIETSVGLVGVVGGVTVGVGVGVAPLFDDGVVGLVGGNVDAGTDVEVGGHPALSTDSDGVVCVGVGVLYCTLPTLKRL